MPKLKKSLEKVVIYEKKSLEKVEGWIYRPLRGGPFIADNLSVRVCYFQMLKELRWVTR